MKTKENINRLDELVKKFVSPSKADVSVSAKSNEEVLKYVKAHPKTDAKVLAKELGVTVKKIGGIRRSITCQKAKEKAEEKKHAFNNYDGVKKQITRDMFADFIKKSGKLEGKIGGLSAGQCRSEQTINEKIPSNKFLYEGYEIELDTCKEMQQTITDKKLNMFAIPLSISLPINNAKKDEYAHFNLDFCVNFTSIKTDLVTFFSRDIMQVDGVTQITIGTRYSKSTFVEEFGSENCKTKKNLDAFYNFLKSFPNYKVIGFNSYKEGKDGMPMLAIFVKRIK